LASQLRFEGAQLEDVLERVRTEVGPDARIIGANRIRKGGVAGFFAKEGYEVIVDLSGAEQMQSRRTRGSARPRSAQVPTSVLDLAEEINEHERDQVIDLSEAPLSTEREDFGQMLSRLTRAIDEEERTPLEEEVPVAPASHYRRVTPDIGDPALPAPQPKVDPRLVALGLPAELIPTAFVDDVRTALVQRLAQLPPPPPLPRINGVVIAVVGIGTAPIALARRLADELEIDGDHVILATPEAMSDVSHPEEAEAFRLSARRRAEPTIVACSIGPGRAQLGWAHRILDRLEPTITWGVVEASVKPEDIAHRVTLLGGVDVLALTGVADTVSPAAVLSLGIPVGRIGSNHATPAIWADLLIERLER
jgi:hypothetical protein